MSSLSRELVFLILQFLDEEKFKETVHKYASKSLACLVFFFFFSVIFFFSFLFCFNIYIYIYIFFQF